MLFLVGGPSQIDTWDPKPKAPAEVRGPFTADRRPTSRAWRSARSSRKMAKHADKFSLVRSVYHTATAVHDTGHQMMQTGRLFTGGVEHPHVGCVLGYLKGGRGEVPAHVLLPQADRPHRRQPAARPHRRLPRQAVRPVHPQRRPRRPRLQGARPAAARLHLRRSAPSAGRSCATPSTGHWPRSRTTAPAKQLDDNFNLAYRLMSARRPARRSPWKRRPTKVRDRYGRTRFGQ